MKAPVSTRQVMGGLASLAGLLALLLGVPLLLVLAASAAHLHVDVAALRHPAKLLRELHRPLTDETLAAVSLVLAWMAWSYFSLCVLADVVGRLRGRLPVQVPGGRRAQALVAAVVGASLSLAPAGRSTASVRLQPMATSVRYQPIVAPSPAGMTAESAIMQADAVASVYGHADLSVEDPRALAAQAQAVTTYTVQPGDTLWSIAERQLGSALRWKDIANLNRGTQQPDGQRFEEDHWIFPGWILVLPAEDADPSLLSAGGGPALPSPHLPGTVSSGGSVVEETARRSPSSELQRRSEPPPTVGEAADGHRHSSVPVGPIGLGFLGAGVVLMLNRMRRGQQRRRRPGRVIRLPEGKLADLERSLRASTDIPSTSFVGDGLRLLASVMRGAGGPTTPLLAVNVEVDRMEFVFDPSRSAGSVPAPFQASANPAVWVLPADWRASHGPFELYELEGQESPCPALVTLGYGGRGTLLVNLESLGSLSIGGDDAEMVLEAIVVELGTLPWADTMEVIVVGHRGDLRGLERVRQVPTVAAAVAEARRRLADDEHLAEPGLDSTFQARWRTSDAAWDPVVVVCLPTAAETEPEACRRLMELAGDGGHGVTTLVGAPVAGARWTTTADGGPIALEGPTAWPAEHQPVRAQSLVPDLLGHVDELVALALEKEDCAPSASPSIPPSEERAPVLTSTASSLEPRMSASRLVPDHEIEVRVLGPVEVVGNAKPFTRAWALELVVYLALHEAGATTDQWAAALWPERLMAPASLHSTASSARRSLGTSAKGIDHLPRAHGRLALASTVTTDWALFRQLVTTDEPESLATALGMIRGRPFQGLRATDWALLEGITATIEATVVDTASRLAEHFLSRGNPAGAEQVARLGLRVSEFDERLFRILLRAADAAGNPAGVESAMRELVHLVGEVEPYDAIHPETLELYRRLSRRAGFRRGA